MTKLSLWRTICLTCVFCEVAAIGSPAQTFTLLYSFDHITGGAYPNGLVQAPDGNFYGTTVHGGIHSPTEQGMGGTVFKITPKGKLTTLHCFCKQPNCTDGSYPRAGLVEATDGNFYGTTEFAGIDLVGNVFKITPGGKLTTLYSFCAQTGCTDGGLPVAGLVQATDGNFYGTTWSGGVEGPGTVFKITSGGTLTTLHSFDVTDGSGPHGLVQATDGNFYGTTYQGGANCLASDGCGTVFKITPGGTLTTLYSFCAQTNCTDGSLPSAGLVQATDGNFYGTTSGGGTGTSGICFGGCGTVFKVTTGGTLTTLHSFDGTDGASPSAALVQATDDNFYGTTSGGGASSAPCVLGEGCGTVFEITPGGTLTTLHSFDGTDGGNPFASGGLVQATDGNFYGTTDYSIAPDGSPGYGTVSACRSALAPSCRHYPPPARWGSASLSGATS